MKLSSLVSISNLSTFLNYSQIHNTEQLYENFQKIPLSYWENQHDRQLQNK